VMRLCKQSDRRFRRDVDGQRRGQSKDSATDPITP
jgi:hypothetical protein